MNNRNQKSLFQSIEAIVLLFMICFSCTSTPKPEKKKPVDENTYVIHTGIISEAKYQELDTSTWELRTYYSLLKDSENATDSRGGFRDVATNKISDFRFQTSKNQILMNNKRVGRIDLEKNSKTPIVDSHGDTIHVWYTSRFVFDQPGDTIMNGPFSIAYLQRNRLHLEHIRTNTKTKKEYTTRLIFYKKGKL